MRTKLCPSLALGALALFAPACVEPEPTDDAGDETIGEGAGLFGAFEVGTAWPDGLITVCWMPEVYDDDNGDIRELRSAGRAVVMKEWNRVGGVRISGSWGSCANTPNANIRIGKVTDGGYAGWSELGTEALLVPAGQATMTLSFDTEVIGGCRGTPNGLCGNFSAGAVDAEIRASFEYVMLHEFGHALGLRHEHARDDSTCDVTLEHLDGPRENRPDLDGEPLWAYDADSVMNYCGPRVNKLSVGDIRAINTLYPTVVGLYSGNDLASGTGTAQPTRLGPGYYTRAQVPALAGTRSIVVPPGYRVRVCTTTSCAYLTATQRTLSSTYNERIETIEIVPWVIGADEAGFDGTTERFGLGAHGASTFQVIADNAMASVYVPPTRAVTLCDQAGGGAPCVGTYVGGVSPLMVKVSRTVAGMVSHIAVGARVVTYSGAFVAAPHVLSTGTYKLSTGSTWLPDVSTLAISGLDVRACTEEGTALGNGGGDCRTYTQSVDLDAAGHGPIKYLKVTAPVLTAP